MDYVCIEEFLRDVVETVTKFLVNSACLYLLDAKNSIYFLRIFLNILGYLNFFLKHRKNEIPRFFEETIIVNLCLHLLPLEKSPQQLAILERKV